MKKIQLLLPDNLHAQLQRQAKRAGFDLSAYALALLTEGAGPRTRLSSTVTREVEQPVSKKTRSSMADGRHYGGGRVVNPFKWLDGGAEVCR